jgi:broad specificity phosphatase PhoE
VTVTTVWFETHSTTTDNEVRVATGWLPGRLSGTGRDQARALGDRIAERRPTAIFTSDLARGMETVRLATAAGELDDLPVFLDWRLRECDYGRLNGADHAVVHDRRRHRLRRPYPGGESWSAAVHRARSGILDAVRLFPGAVIIVVGHVATRLAVETLSSQRPLEELLTARSGWQPGWRHVIPVPSSVSSAER